MLQCQSFQHFDAHRVPSPCFVVDEVAVESNLKILQEIQRESGAKVLLALKAFSMFSLAPLVMRYLSGTCASGLHEARLGAEYFRDEHGAGQVHTYSAAYHEDELREILKISDHVVFNSFSQWRRFQALIDAARSQRPELKFGLRINPQHSEGTTPIYDPCAPGSRLGIPRAAFEGQSLAGISGLHFHTLCEQGFDALERTLAAVEEKFGRFLPQMEWLNFGGGHLISHPDYDVGALIAAIRRFQEKYQVQVYLEPGEAIAIRSGVLVSEVLDVLDYGSADNPLGAKLAILDCSATCHMPDTLEMPYQAQIFGATVARHGEVKGSHCYRLGGMSCLAGDVMGDYCFEQPLRVGQRLIFDDMAHYTMVKTTTFNGVRLPAIAIWNSETETIKVVREFGYEDFKTRLS